LCVASNAIHSAIYLSLLAIVNLSVLLFANYQAYLARDLPSEFSESTHITIAMGSLLEVFLLGIPLLFVASSDPTINYLIRSILVTVTCLSALLPIFLPKYFQHNVNRRYHEAVVATTGAAPVRSRITVSAASNLGQSIPGNISLETVRQASDNTINSNNNTLARGVSKIRRNQDYFKEQQTSVAQKSERNSTFALLRTKTSSLQLQRAASNLNSALPQSSSDTRGSSKGESYSSHMVVPDANGN
jgi:hypothetical protein